MANRDQQARGQPEVDEPVAEINTPMATEANTPGGQPKPTRRWPTEINTPLVAEATGPMAN